MKDSTRATSLPESQKNENENDVEITETNPRSGGVIARTTTQFQKSKEKISSMIAKWTKKHVYRLDNSTSS